MRHLTSVALTLLLAGAGSSLVGFSALVAALSVRQVARAASIHPLGAAAGLLAFPLGAALWSVARGRLEAGNRRYEAWRLRES